MVRFEKTDTASRNRRLYESLKSLGSFIATTSGPNDQPVIDLITISAGQPKVYLVPFDVGFPLKGTEVEDVVRPAVREGDDMIDLPTIH